MKHTRDYCLMVMNQALEDLIYGNIPDKALSLLTRFAIIMEEQHGERPVLTSIKLKTEGVKQ